MVAPVTDRHERGQQGPDHRGHDATKVGRLEGGEQAVRVDLEACRRPRPGGRARRRHRHAVHGDAPVSPGPSRRFGQGALALGHRRPGSETSCTDQRQRGHHQDQRSPGGVQRIEHALEAHQCPVQRDLYPGPPRVGIEIGDSGVPAGPSPTDAITTPSSDRGGRTASTRRGIRRGSPSWRASMVPPTAQIPEPRHQLDPGRGVGADDGDGRTVGHRRRHRGGGPRRWRPSAIPNLSSTDPARAQVGEPRGNSISGSGSGSAPRCARAR